MGTLNEIVTLRERGEAEQRISWSCHLCGAQAWHHAQGLEEREDMDAELDLTAIEQGLSCERCHAGSGQRLAAENPTLGSVVDRRLVIVSRCKRCTTVARCHPVRLLQSGRHRRETDVNEAMREEGCRQLGCGANARRQEREVLTQALGLELCQDRRQARPGDQVTLVKVRPPHERIDAALDVVPGDGQVRAIARGDALYEQLSGRFEDEEIQWSEGGNVERWAITRVVRALP